MNIERMRIIKALENVNRNGLARGFLHELKESAKGLSLAYASGDNESLEIIISASDYSHVTTIDRVRLTYVQDLLIFSSWRKYITSDCMPHFTSYRVNFLDFTFTIDVQRFNRFELEI